jgi:RecB family exonuclease
MPTLQADLWNASKKSFKPTIPVLPRNDKTEEEWREYKVSDAVKTMYVGMTRAKHTLRLSYVATKGKQPTYLCPWITEAQELLDIQSKDENDIKSFYYQSAQALTRKNYEYKRDFMEMIKNFCKKRTHSHSSIDDYRGCPRKYFYKYILQFEGRGGISDGANYGSAVHDTCQYFVEQAMIPPRKYLSYEKFIAKFDEYMDYYPFSSKENQKIYSDRGHNELKEYYKFLLKTNPEDLISAEQKIDGTIDGISVTGRIDKITKNSDGTVDIIDYKTTDALTLKDVSKNGKYQGYYNQVCLYKYFVENLTDMKVNQVKLSFPINSSDLVVPVEEEDCKEVFERFKGYIKQIENAEFAPSYDPDACKYCPYKSFCGMNII